MNDDVRRLLGGYATGSLTEAERKELYEAALRDPRLFEALADEHVLRELLEDSAARAEVLRATESPRFTVSSALAEWFSSTKGKVLGSLLAALIVAVGVQSVMDLRRGGEEPQQEPNLIAQAPLPRSQVPEPAAARPEPPPARHDKARGSAANSAPSPPPPPPGPQTEAPRDAEQEAATRTAVAGTPEPPPAVRRAKGRGGAAANLTAPPPPPAAAPQAQALRQAGQGDATQTAVAGELQLRYTVLLQASGAEPRPVPPQHPFADDDRVLIRFESPQSGWLAVQHRSGTTSFIRQIGPGTPVLYPVQSASRIVEVMFSREAPVLTEARPFRALSDTATRYKVPEATQGTSVVATPSTPPNTLALRIVLERKKD